jgi:thiamine biosynthesis protein ThiS
MSKITIFLNGKARQVEAGTSIPDLMQEAGVEENLLLVELNGTALHKRQWRETQVSHGDRIEMMRMVAGG